VTPPRAAVQVALVALRLDIREALWNGTPLGWAEFGGRTAIADYRRTAIVNMPAQLEAEVEFEFDQVRASHAQEPRRRW
jgi:hypothetical protein